MKARRTFTSDHVGNGVVSDLVRTTKECANDLHVRRAEGREGSRAVLYEVELVK